MDYSTNATRELNTDLLRIVNENYADKARQRKAREYSESVKYDVMVRSQRTAYLLLATVIVLFSVAFLLGGVV